MMLQIRRIRHSNFLAGILLVSVGLASGCGEEEAPPVKQAKKETVQKIEAAPVLMTIDQMMTEMEIDERIYIPEEEAPVTNEARRAVLTFFDAWVNGDHETVLSMVGPADGSELKSMIADGQWSQATGDRIDAVFITTGTSATGGRCVLAIYEVGEISQPQMWNYEPRGEGLIFEAVATPPGMMDQLTGEDLIAAWWKILEKENALWDIPDADLSDLLAEEDTDPSLNSNNGSGSGGSKRRTPGGGGGSKRRTPGGR